MNAWSKPVPEPEYTPDGAFTPGYIMAMRAHYAELAGHVCRHPLDDPAPDCPACAENDDVHFDHIISDQFGDPRDEGDGR